MKGDYRQARVAYRGCNLKKRGYNGCHVDCFCLQKREKKEDEARSIFCFQYCGDRLSNETVSKSFISMENSILSKRSEKA